MNFNSLPLAFLSHILLGSIVSRIASVEAVGLVGFLLQFFRGQKMQKSQIYRLCGGTFFVLLANAMKPQPSNRELYFQTENDITEPNLFLALLKLAMPEISIKVDEHFEDSVNSFKTCRVGTSRKLRIIDAGKSLAIRMKSDYVNCVKEMAVIIDQFIDVTMGIKKDELLVKALIEVIIQDEFIDSKQIFFIGQNGESIRREEFHKLSSVNLASFLLGIWLFVLTVTTDNRIGSDTYNTWCPQNGESGDRRPYTAAIGENSKRSIIVKYEAPDDDIYISEDSSDTEDEYTEEKPYLEETPSPVSQTTINNNPIFMNFNISGNGNQFYQNVENLTINNGVIKKDE